MRHAAVVFVIACLSGCALSDEPPGQAAAAPEPLSAAGVRERTETEWTIKAAKMRQHLLPLMSTILMCILS